MAPGCEEGAKNPAPLQGGMNDPSPRKGRAERRLCPPANEAPSHLRQDLGKLFPLGANTLRFLLALHSSSSSSSFAIRFTYFVLTFLDYFFS